jgi:hypothetical protein
MQKGEKQEAGGELGAVTEGEKKENGKEEGGNPNL